MMESKQMRQHLVGDSDEFVYADCFGLGFVAWSLKLFGVNG